MLFSLFFLCFAMFILRWAAYEIAVARALKNEGINLRNHNIRGVLEQPEKHPVLYQYLQRYGAELIAVNSALPYCFVLSAILAILVAINGK
jgi:hypothetical protein